MNKTDNFIVTTLNIIYSPSDTPKGLGRGFVFMGKNAKEGHAC